VPSSVNVIPFVIPTDNARATFLQAPWPGDVWLRTDGTQRNPALPNPWQSPTVDSFLQRANEQPYAATMTMYFLVPGGLDEASLPATPADSLLPSSSLFVVQLDGDQRGQRLPIEWRHAASATPSMPVGAVAVRLVLGFVPQGRYALVGTSALRNTAGNALYADSDLVNLLQCSGQQALPCGSYAELQRLLGNDVTISTVNMLRARDASAELRLIASRLKDVPPAISNLRVEEDDERKPYLLLGGQVALAQMQQGAPPFNDDDSGGFAPNGELQRHEWVDFSLTIPRGRAPSDGWPIVVYGHGTGGDRFSGVCGFAGCESFHLANAGAAMLAVAEPLHAGREGYVAGAENILTFNFFNPSAGRDNWRQSALEKVQLLTLAQHLRVRTDDGDVAFDPSKLGYLGHSQGGIVGALLMGIDNRMLASMLSGAGAGFAESIVYKVDPPPAIIDILRTALGIDADEPIDEFHPLMAVLQEIADVSDPINYGAAWRHQRGRTPNLLITAGLDDMYTPVQTQRGLIVGFGVPIVEPVEQRWPGYDLLNFDSPPSPARGTLTADDGTPVTAGAAQFADAGHFAIYETSRGRRLIETFFASAFAGDAAIGLP
jgi:hypothetical protein